VDADPFDLVWVDKAVFLTEKTTVVLRQVARHLVHFTPDPAFRFHRSRHFERSLDYYDIAVTTKSYEVDDYASRLGRSRVLLVTQGYDPSQHYPRKAFRERVPGVVFIGHYEWQRKEIVEAIIIEKAAGKKNNAIQEGGNHDKKRSTRSG
jgi:hypothetical protein